VEASVHPLAVIEVFTDVREVFQHEDWLLKPTGVLDGTSRHLLDDVSECVLVVVESLLNPPLGGVTLLKPLAESGVVVSTWDTSSDTETESPTRNKRGASSPE
jgi:hypothetical protein